MKVLFLDIDCVINLDLGWCSESIETLHSIIEQTNAKVVISSDWKYEYTIDVLQNIFINAGIKAEIFDYTPDIIPKTGQSLEKVRVDEINKYIRQNDVANYVAVDDMDLVSAGFPESHFVQTRFSVGLKENGLRDTCIELFNTNGVVNK